MYGMYWTPYVGTEHASLARPGFGARLEQDLNWSKTGAALPSLFGLHLAHRSGKRRCRSPRRPYEYDNRIVCVCSGKEEDDEVLGVDGGDGRRGGQEKSGESRGLASLAAGTEMKTLPR
jgi:hypothetical protein